MSTRAPVDGRSIGELLLDADYLARRLLMDVTGDDAPAMLRTWGEVVEAAADLWRALPSPPVGPADRATMNRLEQIARSQHRTQLARGWPGDGPADERLLGIAETFSRAADLARSPAGKNVRPRTAAGRADLGAARMRVMHTLYVGAHAVGVATRTHLQNIRTDTAPKRQLHLRLKPPPTPSQSRALKRLGAPWAAGRLAVAEELAGGYLGHRFSQVMRGEHYTPPPWGTGRLQDAFASWDVQAHRTLSSSPTVSNLALVTHTQAVIATGSAAILHAAASTGTLDVDTYQHRLAPALDATQQGWTRAAEAWDDLASRGERADPALARAANEVRAAVHQIAIDGTGWATPQVMEGRINLTEAAAAVHQAMVAASDVACVHRDGVDQSELSGSARAVAAWLRANTTDEEIEGADAAVVVPRAGDDNRAVTIPEAMRRSLSAHADQLMDTTVVAASAGSALIGAATGQQSAQPAHGRPHRRSKEKKPALSLGRDREPARPR